MRITKQDLMPWEKTWFLYQSRYIGSYSLCVMMMVLLGYLFAHVDDGDGLLYLHMAKNMIQSQNPWLLFWSLKEHQGFYDHLPCIVWPIAAWLMIGGTPFVFAMYTAMSWFTWFFLYRWLKHFISVSAIGYGIAIIAFTENFIRVQSQPRIDPPFLLFFVLSLAVFRYNSLIYIVWSGLCASVALVLRPPVALSLLVLIPVLAVVQITYAKGNHYKLPKIRISASKAAIFCVVFLVCCSILPLFFYTSSLLLSDGSAWPMYLQKQVLASFLGLRSDGNSSHAAPVFSLIKHFWPGLPFLLVFLFAFFVKKKHREPIIIFLLIWIAIVFLGLSFGQRHLKHHLWVAYPPLAILSGIGVLNLVQQWPWILTYSRIFKPIVLMLSAMFAIIFPLYMTSSRCYVYQLKTIINNKTLCPKAVLINEQNHLNDWFLAWKIVDHLGLGFNFTSQVSDITTEKSCNTLVVVPKINHKIPNTWNLILNTNSSSFYIMPKQ